MTGDLLGPTGPQDSLAPEPATVYRPAPGAAPHRLRRGADREVYGWVRMVPVTREEEPAAREPHGERLERPGVIEDLAGYGRRPNPLDARTPAQLVAAMQRFRVWSGDWSLRQLERFCGGAVSRSTFQTTLANPRELPKFTVLCAFVSACGGGEDEIQRWVTAWRRLRMPDEGAGDGLPHRPPPLSEAEAALHRLRTWSAATTEIG
ncbi:hypothetical protein [Nocardiopsis trehalosi]|uniref:hypothetical protein n=1 Tax=Nocardiopsis trehalosi TaxID=109329 RepID=UPI00082D2EC4|nr:hypothetical protein [Nocardiopsis trehalosi]